MREPRPTMDRTVATLRYLYYSTVAKKGLCYTTALLHYSHPHYSSNPSIVLSSRYVPPVILAMSGSPTTSVSEYICTPLPVIYVIYKQRVSNREGWVYKYIP